VATNNKVNEIYMQISLVGYSPINVWIVVYL